ncbi:hypothetical protein AB1Y20_017898 [Prymnesium parvum]|uniref:Uncharacterized protein n=1 Tax=Prymnesium parvum TaxID=97485 RepID=A0AB34JMJ7_PRYPA
MAPLPPEDRSPEEEPLRYLIDDSDGNPPFDPSFPVAGFSHDAHDPIIAAHNTTLGDTAQVHRQPSAAAEFRETLASGLSATPTTCLAPPLWSSVVLAPRPPRRLDAPTVRRPGAQDALRRVLRPSEQ